MFTSSLFPLSGIYLYQAQSNINCKRPHQPGCVPAPAGAVWWLVMASARARPLEAAGLGRGQAVSGSVSLQWVPTSPGLIIPGHIGGEERCLPPGRGEGPCSLCPVWNRENNLRRQSSEVFFVKVDEWNISSTVLVSWPASTQLVTAPSQLYSAYLYTLYCTAWSWNRVGAGYQGEETSPLNDALFSLMAPELGTFVYNWRAMF